MIFKNIIIPALALSAVLIASAQVKLPSILSDGMVVQRDAPLTLWGNANPNEEVVIKIDGKKVAVATADSIGQWQLHTKPLKPGGPYSITVGDKTIGNVLCGDVLLCSGQSNMELPVRRVTDMFADEIAQYENPQVRQYTVPKEYDFDGPRADTSPAAWRPTTQENVSEFSALAYFMAKDLNQRTGLPVGIVNASIGGTPIEAWISEDVLAENYPYAVAQKQIYNDAAYRDHVKALENENYAHWNSVLDSNDPGLNSQQKWYDPALDDSQWATIDLLSTDWATDGLNPINGSHWWRKSVDLPKEQAGKSAILRMGCIVDVDSVYVNGTLVGKTYYQYPPRIYQVPAGLLHEGENQITVRLISQNGPGHFVPEKPYKLIIEDQEILLDGDWKYHLGVRMPNGPSMIFYTYSPAVLYNAMIAPVIDFPVAGAVWYQGESNVSRYNEYAYLLQLLAGNWRDASGNADMPLYIVELADFLHPSDVAGRNAWAQMRKQQAAAADAIPNAYLIKNSDLGEWNDIHPLDKKTLATRVVDAIISHNQK